MKSAKLKPQQVVSIGVVQGEYGAHRTAPDSVLAAEGTDGPPEDRGYTWGSDRAGARV